MRYRWLALVKLTAGIAIGSMVIVTVSGQTSTGGKGKTAAAKRWTPPRTADGHPDLQGIWRDNNITPLQRPKALASQQMLTDEQVVAMQRRAAELFNGDGDAAFGDSFFEAIVSDVAKFTSRDVKTGNYNQFWLPGRDFNDKRTSLIFDPADGRLPPLTPEAERRRAALQARRDAPAAGPEDRGLSERCITYGVPDLHPAYMAYSRIVQSRDYVTIIMEKIHDVRMIPLTDRPHVPSSIRQWHGDPRGHWEGDTLVIESTNFSSKGNFLDSDENLHLTERFTRVSPTLIHHEFTVEDPTVWTRPWSAMIPLRLADSPAEDVYEYACHEGNVGMEGILAGARAQEKSTALAVKTGSK